MGLELSVKHKINKTSRRQHRRNLNDFGYDNAFLDTPPKAWSITDLINKLDFTNTENFCSVRDIVKERRNYTGWGKYFQKTSKKRYWKYARNP